MARESGSTVLTLRTYRDVPWNAPFYARLGWTPLPEAGWGPGMHALVEAEDVDGLDVTQRVAMVRAL